MANICLALSSSRRNFGWNCQLTPLAQTLSRVVYFRFKMKLLNLGIHRSLIWQCRKYGQKAARKKKDVTSWDARVSADIYKHFQSRNKLDLLRPFPEKLLRKKQSVPMAYYIADESTAKVVADIVTTDLPEGMTVAEVNPGAGLLTRELVNRNVSKLVLFENHVEFRRNLEEFHILEPDRVKVNMGDFLNIWKLHFRDKLDNGSRLDGLLRDVPTKDYDDDANMRLVAGVGYYDFMKHLINSLTFQTSITSYGRPEMFLIMPPPMYIHLTCSNEVGYLLYRAASFLFQIMFEYKFITHLPREHFLPWQFEQSLSKGNRLTRVKSINPEFLYLVRIVPRRNLYDLCSLEDMPALWYFIKQNCVSRRNRIIPNLERWIPGCGPRLIINSNESERTQQFYPDEDITSLPPFTKPCTTMSTRDYFPDMNIFTEFGDLTPSQMLSLFSQFRSWPEYRESLFLASLENTLLKLETSNEETADGLDIKEEDDESSESNPQHDEQLAEGEKRGRKKS